MYIYIYTYICIHTYIYIYSYVFIHICKQRPWPRERREGGGTFGERENTKSPASKRGQDKRLFLFAEVPQYTIIMT